MKKNYESVSLEVVYLHSADVISTSGKKNDNEVDAGGKW